MLKIKIFKKQDGWNSIGKKFWDIGHTYLRNNQTALDSLLKEIYGEICVIGASTLPLIQEIIKNGHSLTVLDFSKKMCNDLKLELKNKKCTIKQFDVINDNPKFLDRKFKFIFADQLINCFPKSDIPIFFKTISKLLTPDGEFRAIIKLGLYEIDKQLIAIGNQRNTTSKFYNQTKSMINYSKADEELKILYPPTSLENITIYNWYVNRGEEVRFGIKDITTDLINANISNGLFKIIQKQLTLEENLIHLNLRWQCYETVKTKASSEIAAIFKKSEAHAQF